MKRFLIFVPFLFYGTVPYQQTTNNTENSIVKTNIDYTEDNCKIDSIYIINKHLDKSLEEIKELDSLIKIEYKLRREIDYIKFTKNKNQYYEEYKNSLEEIKSDLEEFEKWKVRPL